MCKPRLCYLYLTSFPISALSVHPCALILSLITTTSTTFLYFDSSRRSTKKAKAKSYTYISTSVLSFVNTSMCIVCFWLTVCHPCPSLWCHFSQITCHRHCFISLLFFLFANVMFLTFCLSLPRYIPPNRQGRATPSIALPSNCCSTFGKKPRYYSLSILSYLSSEPSPHVEMGVRIWK